MMSPDVMSASDWTDALKEGVAPPNLIDRKDERGFARASSIEHADHHYVYYEEGRYEEPTRIFLGSVAASDVIGRSPEEAAEILLGAAYNRAPNRIQAGTMMKALMNLFGTFSERQQSASPAEVSFRGRLYRQLEKFSGQEHEQFEKLGLHHLRDLPFKSKENGMVYIVSRQDLDGEWLALRLDSRRWHWQFRMLSEADSLMLGERRFEDGTYKAKLLNSPDWRPIKPAQIIRLTDKLAAIPQPDSL